MTPNLSEIAAKLYAAGIKTTWCDEAKPHTEGIDYKQTCEVATLLHRMHVRDAIEAFETTPAIKAHMLSQVDQRGSRAPERVDLSNMAQVAQRRTSQYGKPRPPYAADPNCPLRMKLSEAVRFSSTQESYADHSVTLIPVYGEPPADLGPCRLNLADFFRRCDSHTGWAGSGCNYTATLETNEHGVFVSLFCRASIAD
jgi:hypothetical protein